ncbi:MAG: CARDB domain-containing protein [Halanaeroarchaeum sp.]
MNRSIPLLLVLVVVGSTVAAVPAAAAEDPRFETYVPEPAVTPGQTNQVTVQFLNDADEVDDQVKSARNVKATMEGGDTPLSVSSGTHLLGTLQDGQPVTDQFAVTVPRDIEPGTYQVPITLTYEYDGDERETTTVYASVRVEDRASFTVEDVSSDLGIGETGTMSLDVRNGGTENASDATVQLQSQTENVVFGSGATTAKFVGNWEANETKTLNVTATAPESADVGEYGVTATVTYDDEDGIERTSIPRTAGVSVGPTTDRFPFSDVAHTLRVGEEGEITMTLANDGEPVQNGVIRLSRTGSNVHPLETEYAFGSLDSGERADVAFPIEVSENAEATPRQFAFTIDYETPAGDERSSGPVKVQATIEPERDRFTIDTVDATVDAGSTQSVTVEVTNNGDTTVSNVNAKIFANDPLSATDDEGYVESLEPGESADLTFGVSATGSAREKTYPLSMDFQYDSDGDSKLSKTYQVPVTVTASESSDLTTLLVVGAVGIVIVAIAYVWYRRR